MGLNGQEISRGNAGRGHGLRLSALEGRLGSMEVGERGSGQKKQGDSDCRALESFDQADEESSSLSHSSENPLLSQELACLSVLPVLRYWPTAVPGKCGIIKRPQRPLSKVVTTVNPMFVSHVPYPCFHDKVA